MTASNCGKIIKCSKNPDGVLKAILYNNPSSNALEYGRVNEGNAVNAYTDRKNKLASKVTKTRLYYGASLDGIVFDNSVNMEGGLDCKCPISKAGLSVEEACKLIILFEKKTETGEVILKRNHNYYLQVQGQMFATGLQWVDFVVWFGFRPDIFIERIEFDENVWMNNTLPSLDLFYKWCFLPELLTRRVKRGLVLMVNVLKLRTP